MPALLAIGGGLKPISFIKNQSGDLSFLYSQGLRLVATLVAQLALYRHLIGGPQSSSNAKSLIRPIGLRDRERRLGANFRGSYREIYRAGTQDAV